MFLYRKLQLVNSSSEYTENKRSGRERHRVRASWITFGDAHLFSSLFRVFSEKSSSTFSTTHRDETRVYILIYTKNIFRTKFQNPVPGQSFGGLCLSRAKVRLFSSNFTGSNGE